MNLKKKSIHLKTLNQLDHDEVLKFLAERGADINHKNNRGHTPLHHASESNF